MQSITLDYTKMIKIQVFKKFHYSTTKIHPFIFLSILNNNKAFFPKQVGVG